MYLKNSNVTQDVLCRKQTKKFIPTNVFKYMNFGKLLYFFLKPIQIMLKNLD